MQRLGKRGIHRRKLDDVAGVHHGDAIDQLRLQAHVVTDQDHRDVQPLLHVEQRLRDDALDHHVERARRLISDDHRRPQDHRHRNADALLHATAELVREHVVDTAG